MNITEIKTLVLSIPEVSEWPEMAAIFERQVALSNKVWEMPYRACRAVGGDKSLAAPSAAALLCLCCSLLLVDDMLDEDPRGAYLQLGEAKTANISFAFQSAAFRLLSDTAIDAERKAKVMTRFAGMALTTAYGQELDSRNLPGEENYWKVLRAKNCSYFGTGLFAGAIFGNSEVEVAEKLYRFGALMGEATQIQDDISDALETPANPDWKLNRNNLLLLYAQTVDHPGRERFQALRSGTEDPGNIKSRAGNTGALWCTELRRIPAEPTLSSELENLGGDTVDGSETAARTGRQAYPPIGCIIGEFGNSGSQRDQGVMSMDARNRVRPRNLNALLIFISLAILLLCLLYTLFAIFIAPYSGLEFGSDWIVQKIQDCPDQDPMCAANRGILQAGDQLLSIGDLSHEEYLRNTKAVPFITAQTGDSIPITFLRSGRVHSVSWQIPQRTVANAMGILPQILIYIPFWIVGTIVLLLMQPRDQRWRLLIYFNYGMAIYLAVGLAGTSSPFAHLETATLSWLLVPIFIHLHLVIPSRLIKQEHQKDIAVLYIAALILVGLEIFNVLPDPAYYLGLIFAIAGSLCLLAYRLFLKISSSERLALRLMFIGIGMALGPGLILWIIPFPFTRNPHLHRIDFFRPGDSASFAVLLLRHVPARDGRI